MTLLVVIYLAELRLLNCNVILIGREDGYLSW